MKITVVGGSLVGSLAALLLRRYGVVDVEVYEAAPSAVNRAGGVLGVEHPTLQLLEDTGIPLPEIVPTNTERVVHLHVSERRRNDCTESIYPGRNTTWTHLHRALATRLPNGVVRFGSKISVDDGVFVGADGAELDSELVIFADGRTSIGRRTLDPNRRLRYAGYVVNRGRRDDRPGVGDDAVRFAVTDESMLATFPVGAGADWSYYTNASPETYARWFGRTPTQRPFVLPHHVTDAARDEVNRLARGCLPDVEADLVCTTNDRAAAAVMDVDPPTRMVWVQGHRRYVLVGDALGCVRPHTARGFNNGAEQVHGLATVINQHLRHGADLDAGLAAWERRHLPQVITDVRRGPELGAKLGLGSR